MELLIGLALGWLTLAMGFVFYRPARKWLHTQRYGASIDHNLLLVEYGRRMTGTLDRETLAELLTVELPRALQVEQAITEVGRAQGVRTAVLIGGDSIVVQQRALASLGLVLPRRAGRPLWLRGEQGWGNARSWGSGLRLDRQAHAGLPRAQAEHTSATLIQHLNLDGIPVNLQLRQACGGRRLYVRSCRLSRALRFRHCQAPSS